MKEKLNCTNEDNLFVKTEERHNAFRLRDIHKTIYLDDHDIKIMRAEEADERKEDELTRRCHIPDGRGGWKRCMGKCSECEKCQNGKSLSLDYLIPSKEDDEEFFEPEDKEYDLVEEVEHDIQKELMYKASEYLDPIDKKIFDLYMQSITEREMEDYVPLKKSAIHTRIENLSGKLKEIIENFKK